MNVMPHVAAVRVNWLHTRTSVTGKLLSQLLDEFTDFFKRYVDGIGEELLFNQYLEPFGLQLIGEDEDAVPTLGVKVQQKMDVD